MSIHHLKISSSAGVPTAPFRAPVSRSALEQRIRRYLHKQGERLCKSRSDSRCFCDLGEYYIIDTQSSGVCASHIDLETLGRELEVLHELEELEED